MPSLSEWPSRHDPREQNPPRAVTPIMPKPSRTDVSHPTIGSGQTRREFGTVTVVKVITGVLAGVCTGAVLVDAVLPTTAVKNPSPPQLTNK